MDVRDQVVTVGTRIERIRELRGLSRKEVGIAIGMAEKHASSGIYAVERNGNATQIDTIIKIAKVLDVKPGFLLDGGELTINRSVSI